MQHRLPYSTPDDRRDLLAAVLGDGRPLLLLTGWCLVLAGGFALFLALTGQFLPHDSAFLGLTSEQLCAVDRCRIVRFMIHDRIAFGGALLAIGTLYLWLTAFPLRDGEPWAWWVLMLSGILANERAKSAWKWALIENGEVGREALRVFLAQQIVRRRVWQLLQGVCCCSRSARVLVSRCP
jgi:hypothetical protein